MAPYTIRFFFDWGCTPFWSSNKETRERFEYSIPPDKLPLSPDLIEIAYQLSAWHDLSMNRDYPPDPGPWRQEECDRFNAAMGRLFDSACIELGELFEMVNEQPELNEDPDLEAYLKNPAGFRRPA